MPKTPFVWKAKLGGAADSAFSAQLGSVTYYAVTRSYGHPAYIEVRGARRGLKRLGLGTPTSNSNRLSRLVSGTTGPVAT